MVKIESVDFTCFETDVNNLVVSVAEKITCGPKIKAGGSLPQPPPLRPRVLTPRDHFVHRGGERSGIMHESV